MYTRGLACLSFWCLVQKPHKPVFGICEKGAVTVEKAPFSWLHTNSLTHTRVHTPVTATCPLPRAPQLPFFLNQRHRMTPHTFPNFPSALFYSIYSILFISHLKHLDLIQIINLPSLSYFILDGFFSSGVFLSVFAVVNRNPITLSFPLSLSQNLSIWWLLLSFTLSFCYLIIDHLKSINFLLLLSSPSSPSLFPPRVYFFKNTYVSKAFYLQFFNC